MEKFTIFFTQRMNNEQIPRSILELITFETYLINIFAIYQNFGSDSQNQMEVFHRYAEEFVFANLLKFEKSDSMENIIKLYRNYPYHERD